MPWCCSKTVRPFSRPERPGTAATLSVGPAGHGTEHKHKTYKLSRHCEIVAPGTYHRSPTASLSRISGRVSCNHRARYAIFFVPLHYMNLLLATIGWRQQPFICKTTGFLNAESSRPGFKTTNPTGTERGVPNLHPPGGQHPNPTPTEPESPHPPVTPPEHRYM